MLKLFPSPFPWNDGIFSLCHNSSRLNIWTCFATSDLQYRVLILSIISGNTRMCMWIVRMQWEDVITSSNRPTGMFCLLTSSLLTPSCLGTDYVMFICKGRQHPHKCQDFEKLYQFPKERDPFSGGQSLAFFVCVDTGE